MKQNKKIMKAEKIQTGKIAKIMNKQVEIWTKNEMINCAIPKSLMGKNVLGVGDQVEIGFFSHQECQLLQALPRTTALYRGNRRSKGDSILIAANVQCLLAVVTAEYLLHQAGFIEQAIIAAKRAGIQIGVMIQKWDFISREQQNQLSSQLELYKRTTNFIFHEITPDLIQILTGKSTVIVGDRGCGKTSFLQKVLDGSNSFQQPSTTSSTTLYAAPDGTTLIDTPGFRDFALLEISSQEREAVFPEITAFQQGCEFHNCTHTHEPGCQVIQAIRENKVKKERYQAYQKMAGMGCTIPKASKKDYRNAPCTESFTCKVCGELIIPEGAGTQHRNHCPHCLSSIHLDDKPGDRSSLCKGIMDPVGVWVRKDGEWAIIHRCRLCGSLSSNRIAADDNPIKLMSIALKPLSSPPFPLEQLENMIK